MFFIAGNEHKAYRAGDTPLALKGSNGDTAADTRFEWRHHNTRRSIFTHRANFTYGRGQSGARNDMVKPATCRTTAHVQLAPSGTLKCKV